jgi:methionyl-tRNA formyltransferase
MEKKGLSIFCIGANLESYLSLKFLIQNNCIIDTLITLPKGSGENVSDYYDLHDFCKENKIKIISTTNVNSKDTISKLTAKQPDYLFTLGWSQIFKQDFISCFSHFIIGTHPTELPYGRGRAPIPWTILEGIKSSAVSFFKIDKGIDTGNIIFQRSFVVPKNVYAQELYNIVAKELGVGFLELYNLLLLNDKIAFKEQSEEKRTIRGKRTNTDGLIQFSDSVNYTQKLIRAVSKPYPGAYCYYKDKKIVFWSVEFDFENINLGTLGQIHEKSKKGLLVQFIDGNLWLNDPTIIDEEKSESLGLSFFKLGDRLGYNLQDEIFYIRQLIK